MSHLVIIKLTMPSHRVHRPAGCAPARCCVARELRYGEREAQVSPTDTELRWVLPFVPRGQSVAASPLSIFLFASVSQA